MLSRPLAAIVLSLGSYAVASGGSYESDYLLAYECDSLPVPAGWTLGQEYCDPDEWSETGPDGTETVLVQPVLYCDGQRPPGQSMSRWRPVGEFMGTPDGREPSFFAEARVETDGSSDELSYSCPVNFTLWDENVLYHLTIADDEVRFIRDWDVQPTLYFSIEPGRPHTYRVELFDGDWYIVYIDGQIVDEGVPEDPFVETWAEIYFRSKSWLVESTTVWHYIRGGAIPEDGSGDYDSDGDVDADDYYFFEQYFSGEGVDAGPGGRFADFDGDTDVDCDDWLTFAILASRLGGEPGPGPEECRSPDFGSWKRVDNNPPFSSFHRP